MADGSAFSMPAPFLVGIAGGSGSGKTSVARGLGQALGPERVALLAEDAYYRDRSHLPTEKRAELNYDVPDAFDDALFLEHLRTLRSGAAVRAPRYCFATHRRLEEGDPVAPAEVVIVEGLLVLARAAVRETLDLKVYVEAPESLRLARRLARDTTERGRTPESVITQFTTTVRSAHLSWIEPTRKAADLILLNVNALDEAVGRLAEAVRGRLEARVAAASAAAGSRP